MGAPFRLLWWRLVLALLVAGCAGLTAVLWMSGERETKQAFDDGRRLIVRLEDRNIEGKRVTEEEALRPPKQEEVAPEPVAEVPKPEEKPVEPVEAVKPESAAVTPPPETAPPVEPPIVEAPKIEPPAVEPAPEGRPLGLPEESQLPTMPEATAPMTPSLTPPREPSAALSENSPVGPLPVKGRDGSKSWRYYAKPFERQGDQPMIAIIVTGLGYNKAVTGSAMRLPENITLSLSPYARNINSWATSIRVAGHEMLLDLPLEPANYPAVDPGPYGLLISKGLAENEQRLKWLMARFQGYIGFITPQNEVYSGNVEAFQVLLQSLANRGLMLVVGHEPYKTEIKTMLDSSATPMVIADMVVDQDLSVSSIQSRFIQLEQLAKQRGYAVGIMQAMPISMEQLKLWSATLGEKGIVLAPVSAIVRLKYS